MNKILVEVSVGELLDKISILEIKKEKISDASFLENINTEYSILKEQLEKLPIFSFSPKLCIDVIGSWFGFPLIEMLADVFDIKQIDLYDIDEECHKVTAQYINHFDYDFRIVQFKDFFERKEIRRRQLIINTSSEHMSDIITMKEYYKDYPIKPILAIQSNNYFEVEDHINCVKDVDELIEKNQIEDVLYKGKRSLPLYDRFMVIGKW